MFSTRKWAEKAVKAGVAAFLGSKLAGVLLSVGVSIDPEKLVPAAIVAVLAGANWLKHQAWVPSLVRLVL